MHLSQVLGLRPAAARGIVGTRPGRLHPDDDLADAFLDVEHHQALQSQHLLRQPDTVAHRQGLPSLGVWNHRNDVEAPDLVGGCSARLEEPHSPLIPEEPQLGDQVRWLNYRGPVTSTIPPL
jgi:hypothetical protein